MMVHASTSDSPTPERNPGMPLDLAWVRAVQANRSAVERRERRRCRPGARSRRSGRPPGCSGRSPCMDLTTLSGDDTPGGPTACAPRRATRSAATCWKRSASPTSGSPSAAVCVYPPLRRNRRAGARGLRHSGRRGVDRVSRRASRRSPSASRRSGRRWPPAPRRSTSSSPGPMS